MINKSNIYYMVMFLSNAKKVWDTSYETYSPEKNSLTFTLSMKI